MKIPLDTENTAVYIETKEQSSCSQQPLREITLLADNGNGRNDEATLWQAKNPLIVPNEDGRKTSTRWQMAAARWGINSPGQVIALLRRSGEQNEGMKMCACRGDVAETDLRP